VLRSPLLSDFAEESDPFSLFQISLDNYFDIKYKFARDHGISFSELEKLPYFEFQIILNKINTEIEEKNQKALQEKEGLVPIFNLGKR
jgi:hypothetical protein